MTTSEVSERMSQSLQAPRDEAEEPATKKRKKVRRQNTGDPALMYTCLCGTCTRKYRKLDDLRKFMEANPDHGTFDQRRIQTNARAVRETRKEWMKEGHQAHLENEAALKERDDAERNRGRLFTVKRVGSVVAGMDVNRGSRRDLDGGYRGSDRGNHDRRREWEGYAYADRGEGRARGRDSDRSHNRGGDRGGYGDRYQGRDRDRDRDRGVNRDRRDHRSGVGQRGGQNRPRSSTR
jgi:hypothetical protein